MTTRVTLSGSSFDSLYSLSVNFTESKFRVGTFKLTLPDPSPSFKTTTVDQGVTLGV
jgi:hypothetical protein